MSRPWFRAYAEFVTDPKVQLLAFDDQRHYFCLLCLKCNGTLDSKVPSEDYRNRMIAKSLGLDLVSALEARRRLAEVGLVGDDWQPVNWDKRQYEHDHSTDRVRRHRERKSQQAVSVKRPETVSGTGEIRSDQNRTDKSPSGARAPARNSGASRAPVAARDPSKAEASTTMRQILERSGAEPGR